LNGSHILADAGGAVVVERRTPVVTVFETAKDAVVNISSTQIVKIRSPLGMDQFFSSMAGQSIGSGIDFHIALIGRGPGDRLRPSGGVKYTHHE